MLFRYFKYLLVKHITSKKLKRLAEEKHTTMRQHVLAQERFVAEKILSPAEESDKIIPLRKCTIVPIETIESWDSPTGRGMGYRAIRNWGECLNRAPYHVVRIGDITDLRELLQQKKAIELKNYKSRYLSRRTKAIKILLGEK